VDPDGVLRLRKIVVRYSLRAPEEHREAAKRANAHHARHCPNARSVAGAIEVVTELDFVPVADTAPAAA
jgi:organic hydroperoxide reductase OsmC/OhrA